MHGAGYSPCTGELFSHRWLLLSPSCFFSDQMSHVTKQQYTGFVNGCSCHLTLLTQFHDSLAAALGAPAAPSTPAGISSALWLRRGGCVWWKWALLRTRDLHFWGQPYAFEKHFTEPSSSALALPSRRLVRHHQQPGVLPV